MDYSNINNLYTARVGIFVECNTVNMPYKVTTT